VVFDRLVRAADLADRVQLVLVEPNCAVRQSKFEGAWFDPAHRRVSLDSGLYDLCATRGASPGGESGCLAFLLGHELGHVSQTINRLSGLAGGDAAGAASAAENARREADADLRGGVFGYRAGYDSLGDASGLLAAVYAKYGLSGTLEGYPSLDERQAGVSSALAELRQLIPVFDASNLLLVLGADDVAADCFEAIARRFRSREVYNNKGLAYALWLAALADPGQVPPYPWILDSASRLQLAEGGSRGETAELTNAELFERGMRAFDEAKRLDAEYVPAYVNAACLYDLFKPADRHALNELDDAADHLGDSPALKPALDQARAILTARRTGKPLAYPVAGSRELETTEEEQIGERTATSLLRSRAAEAGVQIEGDVPFRVGPAMEYGEEFGTLVLQRGGNRWAFVTTRAKYAGRTSHDIGLGASRAQVEAAYCGPRETAGQVCGAEMATAGGSYLHFRKARTIFLLDAKNQVTRWSIYAKR
jgi:hypothetical protein